ncbi:MAG: hypothetical protein GC201_08845 [Alphaproteobacteria bacterium]|nr:hypothetical protein [Alphaproteobacteria bacterium]
MTLRPTALERAFELARSGSCKHISDIRSRLMAEGYSDSQLEGPMLMRQLRNLCNSATKA